MHFGAWGTAYFTKAILYQKSIFGLQNMAAGTVSGKKKLLASSHTCGKLWESQLFRFPTTNFFFILEVVGISCDVLLLWTLCWTLQPLNPAGLRAEPEWAHVGRRASHLILLTFYGTALAGEGLTFQPWQHWSARARAQGLENTQHTHCQGHFTSTCKGQVTGAVLGCLPCRAVCRNRVRIFQVRRWTSETVHFGAKESLSALFLAVFDTEKQKHLHHS